MGSHRLHPKTRSYLQSELNMVPELTRLPGDRSRTLRRRLDLGPGTGLGESVLLALRGATRRLILALEAQGQPVFFR